MPRSKYLQSVRRIVVKIGSSSITSEGKISQSKIAPFVQQVAKLKHAGYDVVVVSSGAITAGAGETNRSVAHLTIPQKQALAAVGQTILMNEYRTAFHKEGVICAQILMTEDDVKNRRRFLNGRNTLDTLLKMGIVPIVNENDSVVVTEIKFGDNDTLSAYVANMVEAQLLILLSDIDGFYYDLSDDEPVDIVHKIDADVKSRAGGSGSVFGTGGMQTKLNAADMIIRSGEMMVIALASEADVLKNIVDGKRCGTLFVDSKGATMSGHKRWISFNMTTLGLVEVDAGAKEAIIEKKRSLLAIGITGSKGEFAPGDAVEIAYQGRPFAKGVVNYTSDELSKIMGVKSEKIPELLGREYYDEVIHRDNLIVYV